MALELAKAALTATAAILATKDNTMNTIVPYGAGPLTAGTRESRLQAPAVLLYGVPGAGKTWSIVTLLLAGIKVFIIITEPKALDSILDAIRLDEKRQPRPKPVVELLMSLLHYHVILPESVPWDAMKDIATKIAALSFKDLKSSRAERSPKLVVELLETCNDFVDDRSGKHFGDVATWGDDCALVLDSLSGLNRLMRQLVVGFKPSPDQAEWGIMVDQESNFLFTLLSNLRCYFVVLAHVNRGTDEVTLVTQHTPAAMTYNYSGKVGGDFSEVVQAKRIGGKFVWSTMETSADIKNRALPISDSLEPSFMPIVAAHRARVEALKGA